VAGKQKFKCANNPDTIIKGLENFECHVWKLNNGDFDESCYEIDHKIEHCLTHDDSGDNLQALCTACHAVKTKRFISKQTQQNALIREKQIIEQKNNFNKDEQIIEDNNIILIEDKQKKNTVLNKIKDEHVIAKNQCFRCKKQFKQKSHLEEHLNRKNKCKIIIDESQKPAIVQNENIVIQNDIIIQPDNVQCQHCNKNFSRKDVLYRHVKKYCPVVKQQNKDKKEIFDKIILVESKNKELEEIIKNKDKQLEEVNKIKIKQYKEIKILKDKLKLSNQLQQKNVEQ